MHSFSPEERMSFSQLLSFNHRCDPYLADVLPIDPNSMELFNAVGNGILLCLKYLAHRTIRIHQISHALGLSEVSSEPQWKEIESNKNTQKSWYPDPVQEILALILSWNSIMWLVYSELVPDQTEELILISEFGSDHLAWCCLASIIVRLRVPFVWFLQFRLCRSVLCKPRPCNALRSP